MQRRLDGITPCQRRHGLDRRLPLERHLRGIRPHPRLVTRPAFPYLIDQEEATFFVPVTGNSITGFGIHDGDLLVVDRSKSPSDRQIVIAVIDGAFTVKQLCRIPDGVLLRSHGSGHGDILVGSEQELTVWGVVRWAIHKV